MYTALYVCLPPFWRFVDRLGVWLAKPGRSLSGVARTHAYYVDADGKKRTVNPPSKNLIY